MNIMPPHDIDEFNRISCNVDLVGFFLLAYSINAEESKSDDMSDGIGELLPSDDSPSGTC